MTKFHQAGRYKEPKFWIFATTQNKIYFYLTMTAGGAMENCECSCLEGESGINLSEDSVNFNFWSITELPDHFMSMKLVFRQGPMWIFLFFIDVFAALHTIRTMA